MQIRCDLEFKLLKTNKQKLTFWDLIVYSLYLHS